MIASRSTAVEESFGDLTCFDAGSESVSEGGFANARFAYMQRIVFLFATEHLNGSFQFSFPSDEWIVVLQTVIQTSYKVSPGFAFFLWRGLQIVFFLHFFISGDELADKFG